jgi:predicted chitinase
MAMMNITDVNLQEIMPKLAEEKRDLYLPFLNKAMGIYEINTPLRAAAFLSQIAHESDELKYFEEVWGPTPAQKRYEGRADLGNTQPGDGYRFRGRGPIQLTGRANYTTFGDLLGVDFVSDPDLAAQPRYAFLTAALYWKRKGLNELADKMDFITITKRINGGVNGLKQREKYYDLAKMALGIAP